MTAPILIRRSNLMVPVADTARVNDAWRHSADAVTLDLSGNGDARALVKAAIAPAAKGAAEVFVRINKDSVQADLEASIWPGLRGIMLPRVESALEVTQASLIIARLERERGIPDGSIQLMVMIESARGVWNVRSIVRSSARITQAALDEAALAADLGLTPLAGHDPFDYARGRVTVEAIAAKVPPAGMVFALGVSPREATDTEVHTLATRSKNLGMKGVICPFSSWVAPVNAAFTPTPELVEWNRRVREAFAAGVAAGTAAVPLDGKMIDVPVDEWAIVVLTMAEACAARDAEKKAALRRS